jgi:tetratricopeptide (TPR) repeat protein
VDTADARHALRRFAFTAWTSPAGIAYRRSRVTKNLALFGKLLSTALILAVPAAPAAQSRGVDIQVTGAHRLLNGDTPESARQLAMVDARRQAVRAAVKTLSSRADVAAIKLSPIELEAYVSAMIELEETPSTDTPAVPPTARVNMRASIDTDDLAQRMSVLKKDDEAATLIVRAWVQSEELQQTMASQRGQDRMRALTTIDVNRLVARGALALARTELVTVGGRAPSEAGRRRAKEFADAALALAPDSPEVQTLLGNLFTDAEDPVAAEGAYRRALAGLPGSAAARTKLAEALRLQGRFDEAMAELREVIRSDATYAQAHSDLGMILRAEKKIPEAIASYREAIRLDPRSTDAHNGLAVTLAGAQQPEEAVAEFQAIVAIDPDSTIGYYNLAIALAGLDRDIEAAAALRQVIRINPNHYNAHYNLGEMLRLEGKFDDSATQFKEYLRLAPDTPQNRRNITRAKQFVEQFTNP